MTMPILLAGNKSVPVTQSDSQLMLVVVSVPQYFHGAQYYGYRVRITLHLQKQMNITTTYESFNKNKLNLIF